MFSPKKPEFPLPQSEEGPARVRRHRELHPDKVLQSASRTRAKNRDRYQEMTKDYWRRNPHARKATRAAYTDAKGVQRVVHISGHKAPRARTVDALQWVQVRLE